METVEMTISVETEPALEDAATVEAEFQRRVDSALEDGRPTPIGLAWLPEVISLEQSRKPKEPWLASSARAVHELFQRPDASARAAVRSGEPLSTRRVRHCFEVASVFFNLYDAHGVDLLSATEWLQKCQEQLDAHTNTSEERRELQNDAKRLKERINGVLVTRAILDDSLVSGGVHDVISRLTSSEVGEDWERAAWSVLALRAIAELSSALADVSRSSFVDEEISAILYTQQLGELFFLFGDKDLGDWYALAAETLSQSVGLSQNETEEETNIMELAEEAIKSSQSISEVFRKLSDKKHLVLNTAEKSILGIKFIRYNLEQFPTEADALLKQSHWKTTKSIIAALDKITLLDQIPEPFKNSRACQVLLGNKDHVSKRDEQLCVSKFKVTCLEHQISSFPKRDVDFMNALRSVLRTCDDVDLVVHALDLLAFYNERDNACGKLVTRILEHGAQAPAMKSLRDVAELLKDHGPQWYVEDSLKELVWSYIRPAQIRKVVLDGRQVIEVKSRKIKLSKVLPEVLAMFENPRVEEVRFVVPDCFRLDANLEASRWHGVNLWIQTDLLQVAGQIVLDVSGANGTPATYARRAADGVQYGESGKKGSDGFAGESGGNVSIFAEIDHPERLKVISRGGDGGRGQDGGNGRRGTDGFSHDYKSLNDFLDQHCYNSWRHKEIVSKIQFVTQRTHVWNPQKNFYHITTKDGGDIMYSYNWDTQKDESACHSAWHNHSFFIHQGGPGILGGRGGQPGRGGMGGYGGTVEFVSNRGLPSQDPVNGTNGLDGSSGRGSESGKSGYDIAFTPNQTTAATWYGEEMGEPKSLKVSFTTNKPSGNWTWSPYMSQYALIQETSRRETYLRTERETTEDTKLQTQAGANKKKNISTAALLNEYQMYTESLKVIEVRRDIFEAALKKETAEFRALSAVIVRERVRINVPRDKFMDEKPTVILEDVAGHNVDNVPFDSISAENFVVEMVRNPTMKEKWLCLKHFVPSQEQFNRLFDATSTISNQPEIKDILLDKYRASFLQEVAKKREFQYKSLAREHCSGPIEKYLFKEEGTVLVVDSKEQESVKRHFENLNRGNQESQVHETLRLAIKYFVDDTREIHSDVMKEYQDKITNCESAKEQAWQRYLEVLQNNPLAYDLWVRAYNGENVRDALSAAVAQDGAAQAALVAFSEVPDFDWAVPAKDEKVLQEVAAFLAARGSLSSACFREVLAGATSQHILVYHRDVETSTFTLVTEHGQTHTSKVYVLQTSTGMFPLKVNQTYLDLECTQRFRSVVIAYVVKEIHTLQSKDDIDIFARKFLSTEEKDRQYIENKVRDFIKTVDLETVEESQTFDADVESVVRHFPRQTRSSLAGKLEVLHPRYARNSVVSGLARRLAGEQRRVSSEVVHWLLDLAAVGVMEDGAELGLCQSIVLANRQEDWASELLLVQLECHFRMEIENKDRARESLANIGYQVMLMFWNKLKKDAYIANHHPITLHAALELIEKLGESGDVSAQLRDIRIEEWVYILEEISWRKQLELLTAWKEDELDAAVHFLSKLARKTGMITAKLILSNIAKNKLSGLSQTAILDVLTYLQSEECHKANDELPKFVSDLTFKDWETTGKSKLTLVKEDRNIQVLMTLIKNNSNNSREFINLLNQIGAEFNYESKPDITKIKILAEKINARHNNGSTSDIDGDSLKLYMEMVGIVDSEIKKIKNFNLRATQRLSALLLLANKHNSLIQVATGEGKTMIVLVVAIIKALCGQKVHIVTSSSVLALRDATSEDNLGIYRAFGVSVSHNCSENVEDRKSAYSTSQVVYGDLSNFQRDHLLDSFYQKNIMGDHTRKQNMIIDEVDSMLLDKGNNMLYLSHDIGDLDKLECVYAFIWQWINATDQDHSRRFNVELIKNQILFDIYGPISREYLKLIDNKLSLDQVDELWDRLRDAKIIDGKGILTNEDNLNVDSLRSACSPSFSHLSNRVRFLLEQRRDRVRTIEVPNFLKPFVALHLEVWIRNAIRALTMEEDQDYVVDVDRSDASTDVYPIVTILDKDTGTDQLNSQWDDALHQFLQIKHGCKLSMQSLKAVFISNVTYFKEYDKIYGMTGTLGTMKEMEMLQSVHGVNFLIMPTFKAKKFVELPPVICANRRDWTDGVLAETRDMLDAKGRSALIICETIEEVRELTDSFAAAGRANVHVYTRDYEAFDLSGDNKKLEPGHVVVATNLAGRGTDIKPSQALLDKGGLHVVLTYLPRNGRVEQQAFGRAARKGEPGTGRLVVLAADAGGTSALRIADMRVRRDAKSQTKMEEFYKSQILGEEACMRHFTELYKKLEGKLSDNEYPKELKEVLLQFYINKWALWLDKNEMNIKTISERERISGLSAELSLHNYISKSYTPEETVDLLSVLDQPSIIVKIGKYLIKIKADIAIKLFDDVVRREPQFSESALYYKCAARVQLMHETDSDEEREKAEGLVREDLRLAARAIDKRKASWMQTARTIASIRRQKHVQVTDKDAFQAQTQNFVLVYEAFEKSIHEFIGAPMTESELGGGDDMLGKIIQKDLLGAGVLEGSRVRSLNDVPKKDLEIMSSNYGIPFESMRRFLKDNTDVTNVNAFEKELQSKLSIHNKESFWKILIENNILREEIWLVAIVKNADIFETNNPGLKSVPLDDATGSEAFLYSDQLTTGERSVCFARSHLVATVGEDAFKKMLVDGEAVELKRAVLAKEQLDAKEFLWSDSVTVQQLKDTHIDHEDALLILSELEEKKIVKKRGDSFFLETQDYRSFQLSAPMYEETVLNFIEVSFAYDLAFARIKQRVKDAETAIHIPLMSNPHRGLLMEMFDLDVIKRVRVDSKHTSIGNVVENIYKREMEISDFEKLLKETETVVAQDVGDLYRELQSHAWLAGNRIESHEQRKSLSLSKYSHLAPALGKLFDQRIRLAGMADSLTNTLERGRGLLATLSYPAASLKLLREEAQTQNVNIEELTVFALNGMDHLIMLGEKNYTIWMILSATAVLVMGVCQIIVGVVIEMYSLGALTHFGGALIGEGVGDLIYGISAFRKGEFSWKNYGIQKGVSILISIATAGIGAGFSRGAQASHYGAKLIATAGSGQVAGKVLLKEVGAKKLLEAVTKRVARKAAEGIAKGVVSFGIDHVATLAVQSLCAKIATEMTNEFETLFDADDSLQRSLSNVLGALGHDGAKRTVVDAAQKLIAAKGTTSELERQTVRLARGLIGSLSAAKKKNVTRVVKVVQFAWTSGTFIAGIGKIKDLSQDIVKDLGNELNQRNYQQIPKHKHENVELFKEDVVREIKKLLEVKFADMLTNNLAKPLFQFAANTALNKLGQVTATKIKKIRQHRASKRQAATLAGGAVKRRRAFVATLRRVFARRRDPRLFARLVHEDAAIDSAGLLALASAVSTMSKTNITIVVHDDGSESPQRFDAKVDKSGTWQQKEVHVSLREGRFEPADLSTPTHFGGGNNGHLFGALSSLVPGAPSDATQFQKHLATAIRTDVTVQRAVRKAWHSEATRGRVDPAGRRLGQAVMAQTIAPQPLTPSTSSQATPVEPTPNTPSEGTPVEPTPSTPSQATPVEPTPNTPSQATPVEPTPNTSSDGTPIEPTPSTLKSEDSL